MTGYSFLKISETNLRSTQFPPASVLLTSSDSSWARCAHVSRHQVMAQLSELERAKRRRLQEAYDDLRPGTQREGDRQSKLRNLLRPGAAALTGVAGTGPSASASGGPTSEDVRALAAAAVASITSVSSPLAGRLPARRSAFASPTAAATTTSAAGPTYPSPPPRAFSAPAAAPAAFAASAHTTAPGHSPPPGPRPLRGPQRPATEAGSGACRRAPPPGPMEGGFLPEADPVRRLSRIPAAALHAALGASSGPGAAAARVTAGAGPRLGGSGPGDAARAAGGSWTATAATGVRYGVGVAEPATGGGAGSGGLLRSGGLAAGLRREEEEEEEEEEEVPSDVELALMSLKADFRAHPGCADLPPLALRSQLSYMLTDKSTVERQLDEQRRANRVRLFKLPTGPDEFGILTTSDYRAAVRQAADAAAAAAAAAAPATAHPGGTGAPIPAHCSGAYSGGPAEACAGAGSGAAARTGPGGASRPGASRWHLAVEWFLRRVVDTFMEFQMSHQHLVQLLSAEPAGGSVGRPAGPSMAVGAGSARSGQQQRSMGHGSSQGGPLRAGAAEGTRGKGPSVEEVEEQISLLLHLGVLARHSDGDADAYVLAVPGAGKVVKSILGGRKELLTWMGKRQNQEAPEGQVCKLKLRSSCLPPLFHVRDLVGRGALRRMDSTVGPMLGLPGKKGGGGRR